MEHTMNATPSALPVTLPTPHGELSHDGRHLTLNGTPLWRLKLSDLDRALKYALRKTRDGTTVERFRVAVEGHRSGSGSVPNYGDQQKLTEGTLRDLLGVPREHQGVPAPAHLSAGHCQQPDSPTAHRRG